MNALAEHTLGQRTAEPLLALVVRETTIQKFSVDAGDVGNAHVERAFVVVVAI